MDKVTVTIVVDNHATNSLASEHGFSLWIDTGSERIVFDTGQGMAFPKNIKKLGIDLRLCGYLILSHGHYDHTGGVPKVLADAPNAHLVCHPAVVTPRYSVRNGKPALIQMPAKSMTAIDKMSQDRIHWVHKPFYINERIGITGPIPRETDFEDTGGAFFLDPAAKHQDLITDDIAMWIQTKNGLIVFVGCSHSGLVNTLNYVQKLNHGMRISTVIGGFHLLNASKERLEQTSIALTSLAPDRIIPCHCTGDTAVAALKKALDIPITPGTTGMSYWF